MCAYNHINGDYSCENESTLNQVLKKDWGFQGFVLSDSGGTHMKVKAALAGLDMDQPGDDNYFSDPLKKAVEDGKVPQARVDEMVHRIVRSMFANGVIDQPPMPRSVVDPFRGATTRRRSRKRAWCCCKIRAAFFRSPPRRRRALRSSAATPIGCSLGRRIGAGRFAGRKRHRAGAGQLAVGKGHLLPFLADAVYP